MPQFDNFKYYFKHREEYSDKYYLAQMFYWRYVKPFGYDYIDGYINTLTQHTKHYFKHILAMSMDFEKGCREMFVEMCEELKITRDVSSIKQLVPFNWLDVNSYIGPAYADYFGVGNFTFSIALLITFEQYTNIVFDSEQIEGQLYLIKRCSQINKKAIDAIRERAYRYCSKLYGNSIYEELNHAIPQLSSTAVDDGDFILQWKYVEFMNGKIFLYHPAEYEAKTRHPLIVTNKKSKTAMNYIKRYLNKSCKPLMVCSKSGRLTKLSNNNDLLKGVDILNERLNAPITIRQAKTRSSFHKHMSTKAITHKLREYKSVYLDYLCDHQLTDYNIVYCPENRVNEEMQVGEDSFIFTISHAYGKTKIVFENTLDKRSSIVVECYERQYSSVVKILSEYFASEIVNKRENIDKLRIKLRRREAVLYRVIHTDFESWKGKVM